MIAELYITYRGTNDRKRVTKRYVRKDGSINFGKWAGTLESHMMGAMVHQLMADPNKPVYIVTKQLGHTFEVRLKSNAELDKDSNAHLEAARKEDGQ